MTKSSLKALFDSIVPDQNSVAFRGGLYSSLEFLRTGASTGGRYLLAKVMVPPGAGPAPHIHHWTDEWFFFPDGGAAVFTGTREYNDIHAPPDKVGRDTVTLAVAEEGGLFYGPRHYIHGYINASDKPIQVYVVWRPDNPEITILDFFIEVSKPLFASEYLNATPSLTVQTIREITAARKYGMNFSTGFWEYVQATQEGKQFDDRAEELERLIRDGAGRHEQMGAFL